jgi:DNA polymerase-3 subunit delta
MSVYFFYGDEEYDIEQEIKKLKKKLLDKNFAAMNFKTANNPSFADLVALIRTQPMMFGNLIVKINIEKYFPKGEDKGFDDKQLKEIEGALQNVPESLCIIFVAEIPRNDNKKLDTRRKIFKIISKNSTVQEFPTIATYKTDEIINRINKEARKCDISIDRDAAMALIEHVGNNMREMATEVEKLKLIAHPEKKVTKDMVKEICISNEDLFAFTDFLMKGDKGNSLMEFKKLLDKDHPLKILSALQSMLKKWITMKLKAKECSCAEISRLVGQHEFVVKKTLEKMKDTPLRDLVKLRQNLINAEYKIKSGQALDIADEIENAILTV